MLKLQSFRGLRPLDPSPHQGSPLHPTPNLGENLFFAFQKLRKLQFEPGRLRIASLADIDIGVLDGGQWWGQLLPQF